MIVRVRHANGVLRLEVPNTGLKLAELGKQVQSHLNYYASFQLTADQAGKQPLREPLSLQHGDLVFLHGTVAKEENSKAGGEVDLVDRVLGGESGRMPRELAGGCRQHGPGGKCAQCLPWEPYDAEYLALHRIKHMSFHGYLRKLRDANPKAPFLVEEPSYLVEPGCPRHPPYPAGICSRCQPSAVTLSRQSFRRIDHVEFGDARLVEEFLAEWRRSGLQRFAWLLGTYEPLRGSVVPLGAKATIRALYQPPQEGSVDGFRLLPEEANEDSLQEVMSKLGLAVVGMIYTDLQPVPGSERVECLRHSETFFVSSAEILFLARQQQLRPSRCPQAKTGWFSSKFVTCVLTGDADGSIAVHAYQASEQAVAMLRADLLEASVEPSLMLVKPSTPTHYVPEVFYKERNEYGVEVQKRADPAFPVDYLLVNLSHGFLPEGSTFVLVGGVKSLAQLREGPSLQQFANLSLLRDLVGLLNDSDLCLLLQALRQQDEGLLAAFLATPAWQALRTHEQQPAWACPHCTFLNAGSGEEACEVCGLPRA